MCCISLQVNPHSPPISPFHIPGLHKLAAVNKMHIKWTLHKMHTTDSTIHTAHTMHTKLLRTHTHTSNAMVFGIAVTCLHILLQMHCFCNSTLYKEMSTCTLHILFNLTLLWKQQTKIEAFIKVFVIYWNATSGPRPWPMFTWQRKAGVCRIYCEDNNNNIYCEDNNNNRNIHCKGKVLCLICPPF